MNLGIIGAPGAGKTALALMILEHCSKNNIHCILASIDMHSTRLYEKVLYRVSGLSRDELYQKFRDGEAEDIKEKVRELFKTTYIYDKSAATIEDLANYHAAIEAQDGVEIKMTMVDYFERVNSDVSEDTASSKKVAGQWQDYINETNVAGIMFVQPSKAGLSGGPNAPILDYRAIKGSSFLYQSFRGIISLWRPFYTPDNALYDNYMQMALLKNDLGKLCTYDFGWDGKRGEISELDDDRKRLLKLLLDEAKEEDDI
jgi:adenylate kinase family enzyme